MEVDGNNNMNGINYRIKKISIYLINIKAIYKKKILSSLKLVYPYQRVYFYPDGGKYYIKKNVQFGYAIGGHNRRGYCELQARYENSIIEIGCNTAINNNLLILSANLVRIGNNCRIGMNCQMIDFNGHNIDPLKRKDVGKISEIIIEDNVWIGNNVLILPGTYIGENTVVAAGAVVKGKFPKNVIIGGVPAKVISKINIDKGE